MLEIQKKNFVESEVFRRKISNALYIYMNVELEINSVTRT